MGLRLLILTINLNLIFSQIVARRCGSVPEVIDDGVSGIIFDTIEEGVEAVKRVDQLDRAGVRGAFDRRFTAETMAENYLKVNYF